MSSNYRRSGYGYDDYGGGPQRWDRDRFERMSRSRGGESFRYEEDDRYYAGGGDDRKVRVDIEQDRRDPYASDRYYEDDRYYNSRRSRPEYLEDDRFQATGREVAPYRRDYDRPYETSGRRSQRPSIARRQSSLDTYDRRPLPRYADQERDINVNLSLQGPATQYREYDYGPPKQEYYAEEDYRDVSIRRERERSTYRRNDDYDDRYEEPAPPRPSYQNRRGRTRMPKRLVHRNAILQMGYPFEEEEYFYIVRTALSKDQIDEVIKISEGYWRENSTSVRVDETKMIGAPPSDNSGEPEANEIIETKTTKIIENPTDEDIEKYGNSNEVEEEQREQSRGRSTTEVVEESSESNQIVLPERRKERDIKNEIKALEAERRALKQDRESRDKYESRDDEYEIVESDSRERERDVVRVEKDSRERGKFVAPHRSSDKNDRTDTTERSSSRSRRRPNQKMVNAVLFSLT